MEHEGDLWPQGWKDTVTRAKQKMVEDQPTTPEVPAVVNPRVAETVHYRSSGSDCMAAIIIRVLPTTGDQPPGRCELTVFSPITPHPNPITAEYSAAGAPHCWHRPEPA